MARILADGEYKNIPKINGGLVFIIILDSAKVPVRDIFPKKITGKILIKPLNS